MDIDEGNEIIKDVIYSNISTSLKKFKDIEEFGYFKYFVGYQEEESN